MSVVVNLASTEWNAARGGVVNASLPKSASILPLYLSYSCSHFLSRSDGRNTMLAGLSSTLEIVSRRTSRSLVLLQPQ